MKRIPIALVVCSGLLCCFGCGNDGPTEPPDDVPRFTVQGLVLPVIGDPSMVCPYLQMVFVDSALDTQKVATNAHGQFEVRLARGPASISMLAGRAIYGEDVTRYLPRETSMIVTQDTVVTLRCRMYREIFQSELTNLSSWLMNGSVWYDGTYFVFAHDWRGSWMQMGVDIHVPDDAASAGFTIQGVVEPPGTAELKVEVLKAGEFQEPAFSHVFSSERETVWAHSLDAYSFGLAGSDIRLRLTFGDASADYLGVSSVVIWVY